MIKYLFTPIKGSKRCDKSKTNNLINNDKSTPNHINKHFYCKLSKYID